MKIKLEQNFNLLLLQNAKKNKNILTKKKKNLFYANNFLNLFKYIVNKLICSQP